MQMNLDAVVLSPTSQGFFNGHIDNNSPLVFVAQLQLVCYVEFDGCRAVDWHYFPERVLEDRLDDPRKNSRVHCYCCVAFYFLAVIVTENNIYLILPLGPSKKRQ